MTRLPQSSVVLVGAVLVGLFSACASVPRDQPPIDYPPYRSTACENYGGRVFPLTFGPKTDEDGSFLMGDDGTIHFAFISDVNGKMDVWMTSSRDGLRWTHPRAVVSSRNDDLLNMATRTRDGVWHLTGRSKNQVANTSSRDLNTWSRPVGWTNPLTEGWAAGFFQEAPDGSYWMVSLRKRGGYKLYLQRSNDRGRRWTKRVPITDHDGADYQFGFRITPDGTFLLVYEMRDKRDKQGWSGNIYLKTSRDGRRWTAPVLLSPDGAKKQLDIWPALLDAPDGSVWAGWMSSRGPDLPTPVATQIHPTVSPGDIRLLPAGGYSPRSQPLPDGRALLAWVRRNPDNGSYDYYYRFVCNFDFERASAQ